MNADEAHEIHVEEIRKAARLEERKLIEAGLDRRQKAAGEHEITMHKLRHPGSG